jgi:DNA adenine methylase
MLEALSRYGIKLMREATSMSWGGSRTGAGAKPRYGAVAQTSQQIQQRWRFNQRWDEQKPDGDEQRAAPHMQKIGLSPLQVPGSKLWLVPWFRRYLGCWRRPRLFIEAFAGSGIVGLTMLVEERVERLMLAEKDADYVAVWQTALGADASWLIDKILTLVPRRETLQALLVQEPASRKEHAFHTLVKTWCYHRGRLTKGFGLLPDHPSQRGRAAIETAWKPQVLALRIRVLHDLRRRITVHQGCGIEAMVAHTGRRDVFVYADPPYPTAGERMYIHSAVDIPALLLRCQQAQGPVVLSCEDHVDVVQCAETLGLDCIRVGMHSATNQQMREVLISNRPLPHEPATMEGMEPAQLELGAE